MIWFGLITWMVYFSIILNRSKDTWMFGKCIRRRFGSRKHGPNGRSVGLGYGSDGCYLRMRRRQWRSRKSGSHHWYGVDRKIAMEKGAALHYRYEWIVKKCFQYFSMQKYNKFSFPNQFQVNSLARSSVQLSPFASTPTLSLPNLKILKWLAKMEHPESSALCLLEIHRMVSVF